MTEETFTRELERRADQVHGAPFTFDDVRGRARSIRRRRQAVVAGAAAAVVAAVIVVPTALSNGPGRTTPDPAPSPTTSPSPSQVLPTVSGSSVLHDGGVITRPDGSTTTLDVDTTELQQFGVLTDGRVVLPVPGVRKIQVYGVDGKLDSEYDADINEITMSADDTMVAWLDKNLRVVVLESGVAEPTTFTWGIPMPGEAYGSIDAVFGSDCANDGCTVLVGDFNTTRHVLTTVTDPAEPLDTTEPFRVADVSLDGERWAVTFPAGENEQFGCSGIYTPAIDDLSDQNCDTTLWRISPDGRYVLGSRGDNSMWSSVEVFEADAGLEPVLTYTPDDGFTVDNWGWADAENLYVVVAGIDGAEPPWSLLLVPVDGGEPQVLAGPEPGPNPESSSHFLVSD
jgi:hypothetical protein